MHLRLARLFLSRTGLSSTGSRSWRFYGSAKTANLESAENFYASIKHNTQRFQSQRRWFSTLAAGGLDNYVYSSLWKVLKYTVAPTVLPILDVLTGVEESVKSLPAGMAEEARQKGSKNSTRQRESLTVTEKKALISLPRHIPGRQWRCQSGTRHCGLQSEYWYTPSGPTPHKIGQGPHRDGRTQSDTCFCT
jgi:hypothetical protein